MRYAMGVALIVLVLTISAAGGQPVSEPQVVPLVEMRYCGAPARLADGSIKRRADVLTAFRKAHPCPVTGQPIGTCPGWSIDHVIPLASCGCDAVSNLQWLPNKIKSCAGVYCKDRWERKVYTCQK